jgi:carotenoid cleavage dioxygenase
MAPRLGATGEDDGYLVTLMTDMNADASDCLIFDAARLADGPLCKLQLPEGISVARTRRGFPASSYAAGITSPDKPATRAHTEHPNAAVAPLAPT